MSMTNGRGKAVLEFETTSKPKLEEDLSIFPQTVNNSRELDFQRTLWGARQTASRVAPLAKYLAPITARIVLDAVPESRRSFNSLTIQLLYPLLQKGDSNSRKKEAEYFGLYEADIEIANTGVACEAALMEVLAAEASHTESESEAAALIGTMVPLAFKGMDGRHLLRPVLPMLLVSTARVVRFLHRHSRGSRRLLRLLPTILRRTIATLLAAQRWGCAMTSALIHCVMATQTKRVLSNTQVVTHAITRNALIRFSTVAAPDSSKSSHQF
ncbi:hypothetical protein NUACC21_06600 [Scytonema sp. NUACC21]